MAEVSIAPGTVLQGTYQIIRRVGQGGMGEVYEASHARLPGRYAVKLLLPEVAARADIFARFKREAEVTSSLRHPNIVQVIDFSLSSGGAPFMVMEYLEGAELASLIQTVGPMPLSRVVGLVNQMAAGLAAAHEKGVVHRDLKPQNIFVVPVPGPARELIKIVDFGISKVRAATTNLTQTATVMGTPQYMSPEQALGHVPEIDHRTDQFALAAITYELIAGRQAFHGDSLPALLYQIVHGEPPLLVSPHRGLTAELDEVIRRGLAKDKNRRFTSVLDFAAALEAAATKVNTVDLQRSTVPARHAVLDGTLPAPGPEPTPVGPSTTLGATAGESDAALAAIRPPRRRLAAAAVAAVLMVGGGFFVLRPSGSAPSPAPAASAAVAPGPAGALPAARPAAPRASIPVEASPSPKPPAVEVAIATPAPAAAGAKGEKGGERAGDRPAEKKTSRGRSKGATKASRGQPGSKPAAGEIEVE